MGTTPYWKGGAAATTQIDHLTPGGTIEVGDLFKTTMTDENGSTTTISTPATGTSVAQVCADVQADLDASTNALFAAVTWTEDGTKVIGTADTAGVPFYCTVETTEAGGGAADAQTYVRSSGTANTGPNDFNTTGNWSDSEVPTTDDDVRVGVDDNGVAHSIKYGLNQSGQDFKSFRVSNEFPGWATVGDPANGFYLMCDVSSTAGSNTPWVVLNGAGSYWLKGNIDRAVVLGSTFGSNAVKISSTNAAFILAVSGNGVRGRVTVAASSSCATLAANAPNAQVYVGNGVTNLAKVFLGRGSGEVDAAVSTELAVHDGLWEHTAGALALLRCYGGTIKVKGSGTVTLEEVFGGVVDWKENTQAVTLTAASVFGGLHDEGGGMSNITHTADIRNYGGTVNAAPGDVNVAI
jgi:hypothetical protein